MNEKKQHGGYRPGGGRKSRAEEVKLATKLRNIMDDDTLLTALAGIAQDKTHRDRFRALELWAGYLYGKPTQRVENVELQELPEIHFVRATKKS